MSNRWFLDTEFHEDGRVIDLISIGLVSEAGESYYACVFGFDQSQCNEWVKANVLPKLPPDGDPAWKPRWQIANEVRELLTRDGEPEIWGYFSDYDWVVLCQLYGRMVDKPEKFPFFCHDLQQEIAKYGFKKSEMPKQEPDTDHTAIGDAQWVRATWLWMWRR